MFIAQYISSLILSHSFPLCHDYRNWFSTLLFVAQTPIDDCESLLCLFVCFMHPVPCFSPPFWLVKSDFFLRSIPLFVGLNPTSCWFPVLISSFHFSGCQFFWSNKVQWEQYLLYQIALDIINYDIRYFGEVPLQRISTKFIVVEGVKSHFFLCEIPRFWEPVKSHYPLVICYIAVEKLPFLMENPTRNGNFP